MTLNLLGASCDPGNGWVTGGAGFIGSCFVRQLLAQAGTQVVNLDKLTYAPPNPAFPVQPVGMNGYRAIKSQVGWKPKQSFELGLRDTVARYLKNPAWIHAASENAYRGERLGLI
jgi:dTDP-D-glucose 4,6-dehydratase